MMGVMTDTKVCSKCRMSLPVGSFSKNRAQPDGYQNQCKSCFRETSRRYYEAGGKEKARTTQAARRGIPNFPKVCTGCGETKPSLDFFKRSASPDGLTLKCKACLTVINRSWNERNKERLRATQSVYHEAYWLDHAYGMSVEDFEARLQDQRGVCAICGQPETRRGRSGKPTRLSIDHDHSCCPGKKSCGKCIRGLLCRRCNHALGQVNEDPEILMAMVRYLKDSSE